MQKWRLMEGSQGMLEENSPFLEPEAWAISDNFTTLDIKHLSIYHTLQVLDLNSTSQLAGRTYKVIIEKSRGGRFLWNRNWDLD